VTQATSTAGGEWTWKVGELASVTGLAVRALHYYDQIGLLPASARGEGRHRRYTSADVQRRYRICMLRRLSFPLEEIAAALDEPGGSSRPSAATLHLVDERLAVGQRLRQRLAAMNQSMAADHPPCRPGRRCALRELPRRGRRHPLRTAGHAVRRP
jgi:DNA-binding transcriptional MerR regulator